MHNDDSHQGTGNSINRRPSTRQNDNKGNSYNSFGNSYGNSYNSYPSQQHGFGAQRRNRPERPKQNSGSNEKIIKQNDLIIKLLQEIRDRLPEPQKVEKQAEPFQQTIPDAEPGNAKEVKEPKKKVKKCAKKSVKKSEKKEPALQDEVQTD